MSDQFSEKSVERQISLDPSKSAVVVVDMLYDFFEDGGVLVLVGG